MTSATTENNRLNILHPSSLNTQQNSNLSGNVTLTEWEMGASLTEKGWELKTTCVRCWPTFNFQHLKLQSMCTIYFNPVSQQFVV